MRRICSWGRLAAHTHPTLAFLAAAACATGIALQGCSQGTSGRSLLSRLTRSEATDSTSGQASIATTDGEVVAGGLRQGTRREPTESAAPVDRLATGSQPETPPSSPPTRDPWVRQSTPAIPDDGRPVASANQPTRATQQSRGVEEWLSEIGNNSNQVASQETEGWARLNNIEIETEAPASPRSAFDGQASLASSQQSEDRPVWAANPRPQAAQAAQPAPQMAQPIQTPSEIPRWPSAAPTTTAQQTQQVAQQPEVPQVSRRTDALLQVDALLSRAHDFEVQGRPHEAYRFALAAHRIVETEQLALPPGQERPIDYLDALSAAADTTQRVPSRTTQHITPSIPAVEQSPSPFSSSPDQTIGQERQPWLEASSSTTTGNSPFRQASSFAEWRTLPPNQPATLTSQAESRMATFDAADGPTIRPLSFGVHRDAGESSLQGAAQLPNDSDCQENYGPRFSDPARSENVDADRANVRPASLTADLTDAIDTAALNEPQHENHQSIMPPAWRSSPSLPAPSSVPVTTAMNPVLPAPQPGPSTNGGFGQPFSTFQGPSFGPAGEVVEPADADNSLSINNLDELAIEADAIDSGRVAGKPLAFWAMIGGLVLLLGCALLRRPTESRESFH